VKVTGDTLADWRIGVMRLDAVAIWQEMSDQEQLERLRHHVEAALEYSGGTHNFDDVAEMVEDHRLQAVASQRVGGIDRDHCLP
jgi:hypothetical protein